jgi:WD40 repeat protein
MIRRACLVFLATLSALPFAVAADSGDDPLPPGALMRYGSPRFRHGSVVTGLAWLPDGKTIVSSSWDRTVRLWDAVTGRERGMYVGHQGRILSVAVFGDGKYLVSGGAAVTTAVIWDAAGKKIKELNYAGQIKSIVPVPPDNDKFIVAGNENRVGLIAQKAGAWSVEDLLHLGAGIDAVAVAPDGSSFASVTTECTVRLYDLKGKEIRSFPNMVGVGSLAFSRDGKTLATGGNDGVIRFWEVATGKELHKLEGHTGSVHSLSFSPDGKLLASGGGFPNNDRTIRIWDVATGKEKHKLRGEYSSVVAFSPDGKTLAFTGGDAAIRLWDVVNNRDASPFVSPQSGFRSVDFSPDGKTVAVVGDRVLLLDAATGKEIWQHETQPLFTYGVAFSPDRRSLATGHRDATLRLWETSTGKEISRLEGHKDEPQDQGWLTSVAYSPDGKRIAEASRDGSIRIWDAGQGTQRHRLVAHTGVVWSVAFSGDGKYLASGGADKDARLWLADTGDELRQFQGHTADVEAVALSPDGKTLATASRDGTLRLWHTGTGRTLRVLKEVEDWNTRTGHHTDGRKIAFSPDGRTVAAGSWRSIQVWEVASGQERGRFTGHLGEVGAVAFAPDGRRLVSTGFDGLVYVWDLTGRWKNAQLEAASLTPQQLEETWKALLTGDAAAGQKAVWALVTVPDQVLPLLKNHLQPATGTDAKRLSQWIAQLDDDDFDKREQATAELEKLAGAAEPALIKLLDTTQSAEVRQRAERILEKVQTPTGTSDRVGTMRALEVLEQIGSAEARQILETLAKGAEEAWLTQEAKGALGRLGRR